VAGVTHVHCDMPVAGTDVLRATLLLHVLPLVVLSLRSLCAALKRSRHPATTTPQLTLNLDALKALRLPRHIR
jgi:hypothetical protein